MKLLFSKVMLPVLLASVAIGCGSTSETGQGQSTSASSPATKASANACFGVVNGVLTNAHPAIVLLTVPGGVCTGTFIRHNAVLTASHCVDASPNGGVSFLPGAKYSYSQLSRALASEATEAIRAYHSGPLANDGTTIASGATDLAVLIFPKNTAPASLPLRRKLPVSGEKLTLVGFGLSKLTSYGESDGTNTIQKRQGLNEAIIYPGQEGLFFRGYADTQQGCSGEDALAASGDSGGPVIIEDEVAGVMSGSDRGTRVNPNTETEGEAYAVDVAVPRSRVFIDSVATAEGWE